MKVVRFVALMVAMVVAVAPVASAGGSWMRTPDESVEPGEMVKFVGYVGADNANEGPWYAYLNTGESVVSLGAVTIESTGLGGYLSHRVYLAFTVPSNLSNGSYQIWVQNEAEYSDDQRVYLGDLIGAVVEVGLPTSNRHFEWPADEPLVASLPPDALLTGPGWEITAGEIRQGLYPTCTWGCLLDPSVVRRDGATIVDASPSGATTTSIDAVSSSTTVAVISEPAPVDTGAGVSEAGNSEAGSGVGGETSLMAAVAILALAFMIAVAARNRGVRRGPEAERTVQEDDLLERSDA
jgi:hypothetical protein